MFTQDIIIWKPELLQTVRRCRCTEDITWHIWEESTASLWNFEDKKSTSICWDYKEYLKLLLWVIMSSLQLLQFTSQQRKTKQSQTWHLESGSNGVKSSFWNRSCPHLTTVRCECSPAAEDKWWISEVHTRAPGCWFTPSLLLWPFNRIKVHFPSKI